MRQPPRDVQLAIDLIRYVRDAHDSTHLTDTPTDDAGTPLDLRELVSMFHDVWRSLSEHDVRSIFDAANPLHDAAELAAGLDLILYGETDQSRLAGRKMLLTVRPASEYVWDEMD